MAWWGFPVPSEVDSAGRMSLTAARMLLEIEDWARRREQVPSERKRGRSGENQSNGKVSKIHLAQKARSISEDPAASIKVMGKRELLPAAAVLLKSHFYEDVNSLARKLASESVTVPRTDAWGVLTALSRRARDRPQGCDIVLHNPKHLIGRNAREASCQLNSPGCFIGWSIAGADMNLEAPADQLTVYVIARSSKTYINQHKLTREKPKAFLQHGDVLSLVAAPDQGNSYAFVYRDVSRSSATLSLHAPAQPQTGSSSTRIIEVSTASASSQAFPEVGEFTMSTSSFDISPWERGQL